MQDEADNLVPMKPPEAFAILKLPETASVAEIEEVFSKRIPEYHPDLNEGDKKWVNSLTMARDVARRHAEERSSGTFKEPTATAPQPVGSTAQSSVTEPLPRWPPPFPPSVPVSPVRQTRPSPPRPVGQAGPATKHRNLTWLWMPAVLAVVITIVVIVVLQSSPPPATASASFPVKMNYHQSLASMMRAAGLWPDRSRATVIAHDFPVESGRATELDLVLVTITKMRVNPDVAAGIGDDPKEYLQWEEILDNMARRAASLPELLAFAAQHPKVVRHGPEIVEIGQFSQPAADGGLGYCGIVHGHLKLHSTGEGGFDELGYRRYRFLAVQSAR